MIIRGVMLKGVGIETLMPHYLSLLGLGAALFILSAWLYKSRRVEVMRIINRLAGVGG